MKSAKWRLGLWSSLFVVWIAFLFYLALTTRNPVILSRPQFLVSTLDVVAQVDEAGAVHVEVEQVRWPEAKKGLAGQTITVTNLAQCDGWTAPGRYLLALTEHGANAYRIVTPPRSPGFEPNGVKPRIYPVTEEVLQQLEKIPKPEQQ